MKVKILNVSKDELTDASIMDGKKFTLPSMHNGWRYSFDKLSKILPNAETFVLVTEETPEIIEGCLIFQMINREVPYMAYLEIAPHNQADPKRYEYVAGCLIAFAFKQSLIKGKGYFKGQLFLDVLEEQKEDEIKLIGLYRKKYSARLLGDTRLVIIDDDGHALIKEFLERQVGE